MTNNSLKARSIAYEEEVSPCLRTCPHAAVCVYGKSPVARRLTPLECGRLQGFPDGWADALAEGDVSDGELEFWMGAWGEHSRIAGRRPKTESMVRRWLGSEGSDAEKYRMWGNGIALPCAAFVMRGIAREILEGRDG